MHIREYPLLNTPNLVLVVLREAAGGDASIDGCGKRLERLLDAADEHPPVPAEELRRRLGVIRRHLAIAGLLAPADGDDGEQLGRFAITERGRETLERHPQGFELADLTAFSEYQRHVHEAATEGRRTDPHTPAYIEGAEAYAEGKSLIDNPAPPDTADHLAWENGWYEAFDEDETADRQI